MRRRRQFSRRRQGYSRSRYINRKMKDYMKICSYCLERTVSIHRNDRRYTVRYGDCKRGLVVVLKLPLCEVDAYHYFIDEAVGGPDC